MASKLKPLPITHSEGCAIAAQYLKTKFNCGIVFIEPNPWANSEAPDAIGFRPNNTSILMEVKVSRGDFRSDFSKPHRVNAERGMGDYRFYVCPEGLIKPDELPPKWGLFYFTARGSLRPVVVPRSFSSLQPPCAQFDYAMKQYKKHENKPGPVPQHVVDMLEQYHAFAFNQKNVGAEMNVLYGGYRQMCMASKQNVPVIIDEIFQRPAISKR
ncbi:hypothetical protein HWB57_gp076 [Erwinia phage vB_EamM-Bue1]|uniref:Uncharacterized protein n=1 Tax=Erwinia phage vB_EamM-Bue1 TaxID=2099338 RepID=A0A2P1JU89_9CAUD|nr:hypothetical protein HWB57_gp076 [Erwinia phage vB_EamM-Bue1]AVO22916.1 hypothetical protein [Erwinia phage vB_EamM-Bue1]